MNNNYFFSVIVPCWNCSETIERLLDSLVNQQDTAKEEFEVILCDDGHEDNWIDKIDKYKNSLNIVYIQTKEHKIHCPGNTRRDALPYARGEWITFIDNDDFLAIDAFKIVKENIIKNNAKCVLATMPAEVSFANETGNGISRGTNLTLLHGKFYNRDFLNKYNINFQEDLETEEDLFFNTAALCAVFKEGCLTFSWVDKHIYIWVINPNSLSRSFYKDYNFDKKNYLEEHFENYLYAYVHNYLELWKETDKYHAVLKHHLMISILLGYFYYQKELFYLKEKSYSDYMILKEYLHKILSICNFSKQEIIDYMYSLDVVEVYNSIRKDIMNSDGPFIETQSFKEFILDI